MSGRILRISQPVLAREFMFTKSKATPVLFPEYSLWTRNEAKSCPVIMEATKANGALV